MKFKCVQDTDSGGIFSNKVIKIGGITKDTIYYGAIDSFRLDTVTIFNDDKMWDDYNIHWFEPTE
jgi:hypothetical protein